MCCKCLLWLFGGAILAPNVDFTCVSNWADRVLDYGICAPELADYIDLHPFYQHPCTPRVVAVDFHIHLDMQIDQGYVLDVPKEISISCGPREVDDTWWSHFCKLMDFEPEIQAPWAQGADDTLTLQYARRSRAPESYLTSTMPTAVGDESYLGRGSVTKFKIAPNSLATRKDHNFASPLMSFWDKFANMLKRLKAHFKNGKDAMVMQVSAEIIEKLKGGAKEVFPNSSTFL